MSVKSRLELLKKIEKSAQTVEQEQAGEQQTTIQDKEMAWNLFDQLFDQILAEEMSKINF